MKRSNTSKFLPILLALLIFTFFQSGCCRKPPCHCGETATQDCDCQVIQTCPNHYNWSTATCSCVAESVGSLSAILHRSVPDATFSFTTNEDIGLTVFFEGDTIIIDADAGNSSIDLLISNPAGTNIGVGTYPLNEGESSGGVNHPPFSANYMSFYGNSGSITITEIDQLAQKLEATFSFPVGDFALSVYCQVESGVISYDGN